MKRRAIVPARINIIGEHTDYSGGLALPFAIEQKLVLEADFDTNEYIGDSIVIKLWKAAGGPPASLTINSDIPMGKGMSSSAALCVAIAMCATGQQGSIESCLLAQQIEHEVLGTRCGLLDQMAMVFAKKGYASLIDFSTQSVDYIKMPVSWKFKLIDSGIDRKLRNTNYDSKSGIHGAHVIEENRRVMQAQESSAEQLGELLNHSHESLRQIGVSLPAIDDIVNQLQQTEGVLGARMMGGGFGGMILALVEDEFVLPHIETAKSSDSAIFEERF